ncbi:MAG: hypothetical protein K5769_05700 [Pseudobutyrivibrio sp.]|nr:hypothetical protein [Pseudobutyrivibrio sp.]
MDFLSMNEMQMVNGGALENASDWMLLAGEICFCFAAPEIAVPIAIAVAIVD